MDLLIFDLDGTLTDSKPGILGCLRKVIEARGMGDQGPLDRFIGPPVEEWVVELLPNGSEEERISLARDYRACYDRFRTQQPFATQQAQAPRSEASPITSR